MSRLHLHSVLTNDLDTCFVCGNKRWIELHHIFGGANRNNSTKEGFIVPLCHYCHNEPPLGVHFNKDRADSLKRLAQFKYEETHTREEFIKLIGRNYG